MSVGCAAPAARDRPAGDGPKPYDIIEKVTVLRYS
jgi:hypothetical protein